MFKDTVKLSSLNNDDMLLVGENLVMSKEDYIKEMHEHKGEEVYTTTKYRAVIDARDMLESAIDCEASNMYEDWEYDVWNDVTEEDIDELQIIVDEILSRSASVSYITDKKVYVDLQHKTI